MKVQDTGRDPNSSYIVHFVKPKRAHVLYVLYFYLLIVYQPMVSQKWLLFNSINIIYELVKPVKKQWHVQTNTKDVRAKRAPGVWGSPLGKKTG